MLVVTVQDGFKDIEARLAAAGFTGGVDNQQVLRDVREALGRLEYLGA